MWIEDVFFEESKLLLTSRKYLMIVYDGGMLHVVCILFCYVGIISVLSKLVSATVLLIKKMSVSCPCYAAYVYMGVYLNTSFIFTDRSVP